MILENEPENESEGFLDDSKIFDQNMVHIRIFFGWQLKSLKPINNGSSQVL